MKTSELTGSALDWAVAKCEGVVQGDDLDIGFIREGGYAPSTYWAQAGPIIERENISLEHGGGNTSPYTAYSMCRDHLEIDESPLIAAMRCYVASKLGDEVEIPKELT